MIKHIFILGGPGTYYDKCGEKKAWVLCDIIPENHRTCLQHDREREREPVATIEYQKKSYNFLAINSY